MITNFKVSGMTCGGCAKSIDSALSQIAGVESCEISLENQSVSVSHSDGVSSAVLAEAIEEAGFDVVNA